MKHFEDDFSLSDLNKKHKVHDTENKFSLQLQEKHRQQFQ